MPSRHSVRTYGNKSTCNSSGNAYPQLFQIAEPLWTDPALKSGIGVCVLIFTLKKKVQVGNESSNLPLNPHMQGKSHYHHRQSDCWQFYLDAGVSDQHVDDDGMLHGVESPGNHPHQLLQHKGHFGQHVHIHNTLFAKTKTSTSRHNLAQPSTTVLKHTTGMFSGMASNKKKKS